MSIDCSFKSFIEIKEDDSIIRLIDALFLAEAGTAFPSLLFLKAESLPAGNLVQI